MSTPSLLNIPYRLKAGTLYSQLPETGAGDFTVTRATTPTAGQSTRINSLGNIELVADNVPRLDYPLGGAVNGCPALLVEPAATNGIRNNSMVGASAPNNLPTNWSSSGSGLTRQSVATGTLNGIPYVDIRVSGTATNVFYDVFWEANNIIAALITQDWVTSCYLQIVAQPNPPVNYTLAMREFNSSSGFLGVFQSTALSVSTTSFNRFSFTRALNQAGVAFVQPSLFINLVNGQNYDFTIRIGYPQMERGTVATSVIPTTTAAVTRSADVIRQTNIPFLIGQSEGTVYFEVEVTDEARTRWAATVDSGNNDFIQFFINSSRVLGVSISKAGATVMTTLNSSALSVGYHKVAFAYNAATNGCEMFIDGVQNPVASRTVTGAGLPALSNSTLGSFTTSGSDSLKAHIRAFEIHPNRLTNAQLATLTAL